MNEEEKKAIKLVENFIKYYKKNEQTGNRANLDVLREECNAIEFILNKYDIQQKELDKLRNKNKDLLRKLRNRVKQVKKLEKYALYKKEFSRLNKQLQNKDKQIDLLSETLRYYNGMQQEQEFCIEICEKKECNIEKCKDCIKQYFENKAKELLNK